MRLKHLYSKKQTKEIMSFSSSRVYHKVKNYSTLTAKELAYLCGVVKTPRQGPVVVAGSGKGGDVMAMLSYSPIRDYHVMGSFKNYIQNFKDAGFDDGYLKYVHAHEMSITEESVKKVVLKDIAILWLDLDHYLPTKVCLDYFGRLMASDGIILCHNYGFFRYPGIKKSCDEFATGWTPTVGGIVKLLNVPRENS